jgi:two-component system, NtrC family, response regulator AtoC
VATEKRQPESVSGLPLVLVIEDDENLGELYRTQLFRGGYRVELLSDGEAGLERIEAGPAPEVVVLDIKLQGISGIEVMRRILAKQPDTRIILHSAYDNFRQDTVSWGANAYLVKSFDEHQLVDTVAQVLAEAA